jgi:hypothetical protein
MKGSNRQSASGARGPESAVIALAPAVHAAGTAVRPLENHDNVTPEPRSGGLLRPAEHQARLLPPARYRHPGDVIRLHTETAG